MWIQEGWTKIKNKEYLHETYTTYVWQIYKLACTIWAENITNSWHPLQIIRPNEFLIPCIKHHQTKNINSISIYNMIELGCYWHINYWQVKKSFLSLWQNFRFLLIGLTSMLLMYYSLYLMCNYLICRFRRKEAYILRYECEKFYSKRHFPQNLTSNGKENSKQGL